MGEDGIFWLMLKETWSIECVMVASPRVAMGLVIDSAGRSSPFFTFQAQGLLVYCKAMQANVDCSRLFFLS